MSYRVLAGCLIAHLAFVVAPAAGADWLTQAELEKRCARFMDEPGSSEGEACLAFVQGFLAGARTAEPATHASEAKTFTDRAVRTRAAGAVRRFHTLQGARYCISDDVAATDVIERINAYLKEQREDTEADAAQLVEQALVQSFPCKAE